MGRLLCPPNDTHGHGGRAEYRGRPEFRSNRHVSKIRAINRQRFENPDADSAYFENPDAGEGAPNPTISQVRQTRLSRCELGPPTAASLYRQGKQNFG